jgi:hypothetical protein
LRPPHAANAYASCATSYPLPTFRKQSTKLLLTHQPGPSTSPSKPRQHGGYGNTLTSCRPVNAPSCEHCLPTTPNPTPKSPSSPESHPAESDPHETEHSGSYENNSTNTTRFRSSRARVMSPVDAAVQQYAEPVFRRCRGGTGDAAAIHQDVCSCRRVAATNAASAAQNAAASKKS